MTAILVYCERGLNMKRFISILITASMLCAAAVTVSAADVSYMADFEEAAARFGKSTVYGGFKNSAGDYNDFIKPIWAEGEGKNGTTGLEINYKAASWYAGEIFFPFPSSWGNGSGAKYLNFDYKGIGKIKISLSTGNASNDTLTTGTKYGYTITANTNGEWESISIPLSSFVNGTTPVTITEISSVTFQAGESANLNNNAAETKAMSASELEAVAKSGSIVFDNMELSSKGENAQQPTQTTAPSAAPDNSTRVIDFDNYSLSQKQTWGGFKNNSGDYSDYIKYESTDQGKDGKGAKLTYKAATWYSGEVFCAIPKEWAVSKSSNYLEFDAKGHAIIKVSLETGEVVNGKRYEQRVNIDTNGEWKRFSMPLADFVNGGESITLREVTGMTFKAVESGNLNNSAEETKAMTADELEAAAKTGEVIIDNLELTVDSSSPVTPDATAEPTEAPDGTTRVIDFDDYSLSQKQTWAGFKNDAADYTDSIKSEITDQGKAGKGFKLTYNAATWYSGEVFCAVPKEWAVNKTSNYLEFDAKGRGVIMIALETGEVINGKRYEQRVNIDTDGEWQRFSIPVSVMKKGDEIVPLSDVTGMTFKAAESGNLNNNAAETKAMTKAELEAAAKTGEVVIDNITLSESYTAQPNVTITLSQDSRVLTSASDIDPEGGKIKISMAVSNCMTAQSVALAAAIYDNGVLDDVDTAENIIDYSGTVELTVNAAELTGKTMKLFVLDSLSSLKPLSIPVMF